MKTQVQDRITAYLEAERVRRRPGGVAAYGKVLSRLERYAGGRDLTAALVAAYIATRAGRAPATINFEITVIASFERWMRRRKLADEDLLGMVDRPRKTRRPVISAPREQIARVVAWLDGDEGHARTRRFMALCLYAGLRISEARLLDWRDVDELAGELVVRDGKGGQSRRVPIAAPLERQLGAVPRHQRVGAVAGIGDGRPLSRGGAEHLFRRELRRAGIVLSAHMLRRAFATRIDERGHSLRVVQELLGHSSLATTERYIGVERARKAAAVADLEDAW